MRNRYVLLGVLLAALALVLAGCQSAAPAVEATPCPTAPPCPTCPPAPACPDCPDCPEPVVKDVPFEALWMGSPHNDAEAEAFVHWNEDDPAEVPANCAKCHSTPGMLDFLGADGSEAGKVDVAAPIGTTVQCIACHNDATLSKTSVVFPSGAEITGLGGEAICMECHQGRASKVSIDDALTNYGVTPETLDQVPAPVNDRAMGFVNIHYYAAGATLYGAQAMGGYQYEGKTYDYKFRHVEGIETCTGCHDQHSLQVKVESCQTCHEGVASVEDFKNVRMNGSLADYDGDGDQEEGIYYELDGLRAMLYSAIQAYAKDVAGTGIVYDSAAYPYFFTDADGDGAIDQADGSNVSYSTWTGRLLKAGYNYQVSAKDPGAFAHGGKYIMQLLYDSIEDLNSVLPTPVDLSTAHREDPGHFAGSTEAFRHWDAEGEVPGSCAKCHSADGLPTFIKNGATIATHPANGFMCTTCHDEANWPALYAVNEVTFPSGSKVTFGEGKGANLCLQCHQGRESTTSVNRAIGSFADDQVALKDDGSAALSFRNVHYFAAGATLFGTDAKGAYEYEGKEYLGAHAHVAAGFDCSSCHDVHALEVKVEACAACHPAVSEGLEAIRFTQGDFDGDGDSAEGIAGEVDTMAEKLYDAIKAYAAEKSVGIVYNAAAYPYFFEDADGDGNADKNAEGASVRYSKWTPRLLRAAYNYQYALKDPGAFAHNAKYVMQFLYDGIQDLGGDVAGMTRP